MLPHPSGPASAAVAVPTAVNADSRCTLAGGWRSHESSSLFHSLASAVWGKSVGRSLFQSSHASARSARTRTSRVAKAVWEKPVHPSRWGPSLFRSSLPTSYSPSCEKKSESEWVSEWSNFWVFKNSGSFICYRGCLNLNCYIGKKVQKNFLMGLKIWWSWGSRIFFSKSA